MPLKPCRVCRNPVATDAPRCPACGHAWPHVPALLVWLALWCVFVIGASVGLAALGL